MPSKWPSFLIFIRDFGEMATLTFVTIHTDLSATGHFVHLSIYPLPLLPPISPSDNLWTPAILRGLSSGRPSSVGWETGDSAIVCSLGGHLQNRASLLIAVTPPNTMNPEASDSPHLHPSTGHGQTFRCMHNIPASSRRPAVLWGL